MVLPSANMKEQGPSPAPPKTFNSIITNPAEPQKHRNVALATQNSLANWVWLAEAV